MTRTNDILPYEAPIQQALIWKTTADSNLTMLIRERHRIQLDEAAVKPLQDLAQYLASKQGTEGQ